jgi:hypothetical protein
MHIDLAPVDVLKPFARPKGESEANWFSPKLQAMWVDSAGASPQNATAHELSHVLLNAFTPYGNLIQELNYIQSNQVLNYCSHVARIGRQKILVPVYGFAKDFSSSPTLFESLGQRTDFGWLIAKFVRPWSHSWYLEQILEGESLPSVRAADQVAAVRALNMCEDYAAAMLSDEQLFGSQSVPIRKFEQIIPVQPTDSSPGERLISQACFDLGWRSTENRKPLGAKHIFEGHAQRYGQLFGGPDPEEEDLVSTDFGHFYLWCWASLLQEFFKTLGSTRDPTAAEFKQVMNTFWALCDLALFTPLGVVYGRLRTRKLTWVDVHPGWRFMTAMGQLASIGWLTDLFGDFSRFQNRICQQLGWPAPERFIELGSQLIESNFLMHRDACLMRTTHPCPYLQEDLSRPSMVKLISDHMPIYHSSQGDDLVIRGETAEECTRVLLNYFLPQICWQIMMHEQLDYEALLPRTLRIDHVFSNVQSNDRLLEIIFEAVSIIAPENFLPLKQFYSNS